MGPIAAKTYPGEEWKQGPYRATFEPDYGRRGKVWVHGAFEPATGKGTIVMSPARDSASHIQLIEQVVEVFPSDRWLLIEDNLSIHTSHETTLALAAWPEIRVQFLPTQAPWLNLIEPWWKQLRSLGLKGRRFENIDEVIESLTAALAYWNDHRRPYRWKKRPQEQVLIGAYGVSHNYLNI